MGISIKATSNDQTKPDYVQATEAFGALVVAAGECKVWVGSTPVNKLDIIEGLRICQNELREQGYPDPGAGDEVVALFTPGLGSQLVTVTNQTALPTFAETNVAILIGAGFGGPASSGTFDGHITRLIEKYLEDVLKTA